MLMKHMIIGNGVAGSTAAYHIRKHDSSGDITIMTNEATPFYSRIRLIEYLAGEAVENDIVIHKSNWYEKNNIRLLMNTTAVEIDKERKEVVTSIGNRLGFDKLLLATGGFSFVPPITGSDKKGVFTLRTIRDADEIISYSNGMKKVLIIGGGVLGLEAGNALRKRGLNITVVEFFPRLLPRQMDPEGAEILKTQLESMGFIFYLGARSKEITGDDRAQGLVLEDGTKIDSDLIIISAGIRPSSGLGMKLGLAVNRGLIVNDMMETGIKDIYAAGDLIEHRGVFYGIWPASEKQGEIAGINMAGGNALYEGTTMSNVLKIVGIDIAAAGDIDADGKYESVIQKDTEKYIYKKLVIKDNILSGAILYGDISGYRRILKAIDEKKDIGGIKNTLLQNMQGLT
jgi:nitrite reductase (NADH) large subunit